MASAPRPPRLARPIPVASPSRTRRGRLLEGLVLALLALSLAEALTLAAGGALHGNDFKHLWAGAWLLAHGRSPYQPENLFKVARSFGWGAINPYVTLPTTGLLMRPLAALDYGVAKQVWFWLNWALAWGVVLRGPGLLRVARPGLARLAGAVFLAGAFPFFRQMTAGQMNVVMAALILGAGAALVRGRERWAGAALGLGVAWKISPALLIAALAVQGRRRAALWGLAVGAALLLVSVALYGWPIHREALSVVRQMGYGQSTWASQNDFYRDPFNQSPNALLHHLLTQNPYTTPWLHGTPALADGLTVVVSLALGAAWLAQALRLRRRGQARQAEMPLFLAATLAMLLLPSLMWDHYVVQALPALLWLFGSRGVARSPARVAGALAILLTLGVLWRHGAPAWSGGLGVPLMSLRLWPLLALYGWLLYDPALWADAPADKT